MESPFAMRMIWGLANANRLTVGSVIAATVSVGAGGVVALPAALRHFVTRYEVPETSVMTTLVALIWAPLVAWRMVPGVRAAPTSRSGDWLPVSSDEAVMVWLPPSVRVPVIEKMGVVPVVWIRMGWYSMASPAPKLDPAARVTLTFAFIAGMRARNSVHVFNGLPTDPTFSSLPLVVSMPHAACAIQKSFGTTRRW